MAGANAEFGRTIQGGDQQEYDSGEEVNAQGKGQRPLKDDLRARDCVRKLELKLPGFLVAGDGCSTARDAGDAHPEVTDKAEDRRWAEPGSAEPGPSLTGVGWRWN